MAASYVAPPADGSFRFGPQPLTCTVSSTSQRTTIRLTGDLDLASAPTLNNTSARISRAGDRLILDVSGVTFVDAAGISALLTTRRTFDTRGTAVVLRGTPPCLHRLLAVTKLTDVFVLA